jgi:ribosome-binding ATPase YchF (GTP1/OBG family)
MSRSLKRILKIRELVEDQSRLRMETAMRDLAQIELNMDRWHRRQMFSREYGFDSLMKSDFEGRLAAEAEEYLSGQRVERLIPVRHNMQQQVFICRSDFLEKRKQTLQASTLLDKAEAEAEAERLKREQMALDEWYQSERMRAKLEEERREKRKALPSPSSAGSD